MAAPSSPSISNSQLIYINNDFEKKQDDYVIVGSFNNKIFEKYDELLIKVNEILNRVHTKTSTK